MRHNAGMSKETQTATTTSTLVDDINRAFLDTNYRVRILKTTANERIVRFRLEGDIFSPHSGAQAARIHLAGHGIYAKASFDPALDGWHTTAKAFA